ncbi:MAG TPA: lamin tail domain-containing protein, partial [Verrucomicrobiae bacterium]|nr:lamin tail domain-containing protein [Verrucomicrobiae bacterium]
PGSVTVSWAQDHNISDLATPANPFAGNAWSYSIDPSLPLAQVIISEFLASAENSAGLKDEDGELQDWIELENVGSTPASLAGWSLTDDPDDPDLWELPDLTLQPGERLVIFASSKDRRSLQPGTRLHTNFKLNSASEYLGLFNAASPRQAATEFKGGYPDQRNDYSYGWDGTSWRYYRTPTPGLPNGSSSILGLIPNPGLSVTRGFFEAPFSLVMTNKVPGSTIRYTLDGSIPTESSGRVYTSPLLITNSTVLRLAAFEANFLPSETLTHTYLFLDQVIHQPNNPPGFPTGATVMAGYPSDYEMDSQIVNDPLYASEMKAALQALPALSIVMKIEDLFGAANGIYTHPLSRGPQWERPCSIEFMPLDGKDFQSDAGIQVQGNAAREPIKTPKHPLRVLFKGDYGPKSLNYKLFPDSPVDLFDTLVLRADFGYSWLHWNPTQRVRAQRSRDAWMKDTMRSMGSLASHNRYVHLYLNGVYWGVYDPSERPDGSFGEAYLGGEKVDYDVINEGAAVDGTIAAYNKLLALPAPATIEQYNLFKEYLDIPQFIDYMILHFFVGHEDWGNNKNWYTLRPKDGSRGFLYVPWDGENILVDPAANRVSNPDVPSGLHTKLLASAQYRVDFADRVQRHLFAGGALTPAENIGRWQKRARELELPIVAESARWGDYRRDVHPYQTPPYELYTRNNQWRTEQSRLLNNYFPGRTTTVLNQLRTAGLYPSLAAPLFNQLGGKIQSGFQLQISAPSGTIYYTTNGADPRIYGLGELSPPALVYSGALVLNESTTIKARVLSGSTWSALTEGTFSTRTFRTPLRITEIMYNPAPSGDAFEFVELQNLSPLPFDATGYSLRGVDYIFPPGSVLKPGQVIVLGSSENPATFAQRYPGVEVFGRFNGQLVNRGERVTLVSPAEQPLYSIDYLDKDGWPEAADGQGSSLEIKNPYGDLDDPANWRASANIGGSPGLNNPEAAVIPPVRINEILTSAVEGGDWVELFNSSLTNVDLSGWVLREVGNSNHFNFPGGTILPA